MLIQLNSTSKPHQIRLPLLDICHVAINEVVVHFMSEKKAVCRSETGKKNRILITCKLLALIVT